MHVMLVMYVLYAMHCQLRICLLFFFYDILHEKTASVRLQAFLSFAHDHQRKW